MKELSLRPFPQIRPFPLFRGGSTGRGESLEVRSETPDRAERRVLAVEGVDAEGVCSGPTDPGAATFSTVGRRVPRREGFPTGPRALGPIDSLPSFSPAGPVSAPSIESRECIKVGENEWRRGEIDTPFVINTGGCGAVKIFVEGSESSYAIVFHSFGDQKAKEVAARQIGPYILGQEDRPKAVRMLCIQPYDISRDVTDSVHEISEVLEGAGLCADVRTVCLNNIGGEKYSKFHRLNLKGFEEQILGRYDDLTLKSRDLSEADRSKKIALFQSLPLDVRTPEFMRTWSSLSLEEARGVVAEIQERNSRWSLRRILSRWSA